MNETTNNRPPKVSQDTMKKIMWLYRTRNCPLNKRGQCNYGMHCFDSHQTQPERRAPKQNQYNDWHPSKMQCTSGVAIESCKYGRACTFAHGDFEMDYHPVSYKTKACAQFQRDETCDRGMVCPHYHYPEEQRKIEEGSLCSDCKSDGLSRKAPPPQEYRRWLDRWLKRGANATAATAKKESTRAQQAMNIADTLHAMSLEHEVCEEKSTEHGKPLHSSRCKEVDVQLPDADASHSNLSLRNVSVSPNPLSPSFNDEEKWQPTAQKHTQSRAPSCLPSIPHSTNHSSAVAASTRSVGNLSVQSNHSAKSKKSSSAHASSSNSSSKQLRSTLIERKRKKRNHIKPASPPQEHQEEEEQQQQQQKQQQQERKQRRKQRAQLERDSLQIMKTYKVNECRNTKCSDVLCPHFHSWQDRRRCPFTYTYSHCACPQVFDMKTRKFGDTTQCLMRDGCGYAHNYMEVWYHPSTFHTRMCPLVRYQQPCPWNFHCSHYHRKLHRRKVSAPHATATVASNALHIKQQQQQQQQQLNVAHAIVSIPPNLSGSGMMQMPAAAVPLHSPSQASYALNGTVLNAAVAAAHNQAHIMFPQSHMTTPAACNGVPVHPLEAQFAHQSPNYNNGNKSYSFNPLMQGIAPSIHSWRQKTIENNSMYQ
eukprot:CAMPEP_0202698764 /NCGR_PEP_ID=MMETSP1385-20130828/11993_1 /ASSEMBLY_ACC=CAM_ASM_000861 /TAXON_ID=933848 /ORGANISM="Elphidium margaritaceum" /LENGTH=648 /DNA_ID=CAMNT_0049355537 /DNA_START=65 /DNA_END=2011 /DNA_ORIENTATION=+